MSAKECFFRFAVLLSAIVAGTLILAAISRLLT